MTKPYSNVAMSNGRADHAYLDHVDEPAVDLVKQLDVQYVVPNGLVASADLMP